MQTRCELKIPSWEDMRYDVSPNDERRPSSHVDRTSRHLTRQLAYAVCGWDQYIATLSSSHACTQLHTTPTVIFLGIGEIPIETDQVLRNSDSLLEKNFSKINVPNGCCVACCSIRNAAPSANFLSGTWCLWWCCIVRYCRVLLKCI